MMTKFCVLLIRSLWLRVVKDGTNVFCILGLLGDHVSRKPVIGRAKWKCSVADVASFAMTSSWKIVTYIDILTRFTPAEAIHFACPHLCAAMCRHFLLRHKLHRLICLCRYLEDWRTLHAFEAFSSSISSCVLHANPISFLQDICRSNMQLDWSSEKCYVT